MGVHEFKGMETKTRHPVSGRASMWVKGPVANCLCFFLILRLVTHVPSLLKKRLTVPSLNPLRLNAFQDLNFSYVMV